MLKTNVVLAIMIVLIGLLFSAAKSGVHGQGTCQGTQGLISYCASFVQKGTPKVNPSSACCNVVKTVDIPCLCKRLTKVIERIVDMEKVVFVAQYCGRPLAHGTKCGTYTVP